MAFTLLQLPLGSRRSEVRACFTEVSESLFNTAYKALATKSKTYLNAIAAGDDPVTAAQIEICQIQVNSPEKGGRYMAECLSDLQDLMLSDNTLLGMEEEDQKQH